MDREYARQDLVDQCVRLRTLGGRGVSESRGHAGALPGAGTEAISGRQALERFVKNYDSSLKIRVAPLWVMRMIGLFNPKMKFVAHLFAYCGDHEDPFYAEETWQELGKPTTTLEMFANQLRQSRNLQQGVK